MTEYAIKITCFGWFTCDAGYYNHEGGFVKCPEFETIEELSAWVAEFAEDE